jgi:hypothetical protein
MRSQVRRVVRFAALTVFGLCALSWLGLYFDSLHERRRTEHLIADLKSFPFSTAGFPEVRDFANRHGGRPILQFPDLQFSPPGLPNVDGQGVVHLPIVEKFPTCTAQDCVFEIIIKPRISSLISYRTPLRLWLQSAFVSLGIRPWLAGVRFELKDGALVESSATAGQLRRAQFSSADGLDSLGYSVHCKAHPASGEENSDFNVFKPHINGRLPDVLFARVLLTPDAPIQRAFDINVHCFSAVFRACRGLDELAPSAWAEYQAGKAKSR